MKKKKKVWIFPLGPGPPPPHAKVWKIQPIFFKLLTTYGGLFEKKYFFPWKSWNFFYFRYIKCTKWEWQLIVWLVFIITWSYMYLHSYIQMTETSYIGTGWMGGWVGGCLTLAVFFSSIINRQKYKSYFYSKKFSTIL